MKEAPKNGNQNENMILTFFNQILHNATSILQIFYFQEGDLSRGTKAKPQVWLATMHSAPIKYIYWNRVTRVA